MIFSEEIEVESKKLSQLIAKGIPKITHLMFIWVYCGYYTSVIFSFAPRPTLPRANRNTTLNTNTNLKLA